jgi:HAD superfamily hydrolase (TIGR01509 family)
MRIDAVVFDFDGVILDTESARFEAWKKIFNNFDQELPFEIWTESIGRSEYVVNPYDLLRSLTGRDIATETIRAMERQYEMEYIALQPLMSGVVDRILEAKEYGAGIAIASSSSRGWVEGHLREREIFRYFDAIVCRNDVERHKPHPDPYQKALQHLNANAADSFAIEDSPAGIEAAVSAGMFCIAIKGAMTRHMDQSKAHLCLDSLAEITFNALLKGKK